MTDSHRDAHVRDYLADLRIRGRSDGTRTRYEEVLADLARHAGTPGAPASLLDVTRADVRDWLSGHQRNAAAFRLRHAKPFFSWAVSEGVIADNPCRGLSVTPVAEPQLTASDADVARMLDFSQSSRDAVRDRAILTLLTSTGARRGEVGSLTVDDVSLFIDSGMVRISRSKTTPRIVPVTPEAESALRKWLRHRSALVARSTRRGAVESNLWLVSDGSQLVGKVVHRRSQGTLTPHSLRRWFASNWLRRGGSETSLTRICGWSTSAMVSTYTRAVGEDVARDEFRRVVG